jgi:hypothetical protein
MLFFIKILKCLFHWWKRKPQGKMEEAEVIIVLAFGHRGPNNPGDSNIFLAKAVSRTSLNLAYILPMILQGEILQALPWSSPRDSIFSIEKHRQPGKYLDTREFLLHAWEFCVKSGLGRNTKAIIIAHPWHLPRIIMMAERIGFRVVVPNIGLIAFDPDSHQWWTRNWFLWIIRELPGRILCLIKGWI